MANLAILTSFDLARDEVEAMVAALGAENVVETVYEIPQGSIVIPRYRAIPFGNLLEKEVSLHGSTLINSHAQHRNIADSMNWNYLLKGMTAPEYDTEDILGLPDGEYFVKGETNSIKNKWLHGSYAPNKKALIAVIGNFQQDSYVGNQRIVIKPFQKYRQLRQKDGSPLFGVNGQPIFHERRVFVYNYTPISEGFYWSSFVDEAVIPTDVDEKAYQKVLTSAINEVGHLAPYFVIDLAEYEDGSWGVVELNDASMSGLSQNAPERLYSRLKQAVEDE